MHYAIKNMYPIETEDQLKTASVYFGKYLANFHPAERVAIAGNMEKRASDLGVKIDADWMHNYTRKTEMYSPDFDMHMTMRKEACAGKKIKQSDKLIDAQDLLAKVASMKSAIKPKEMVDLVSEFDKKAGLVESYDRRIRDPFFTVYGSSTNPRYDHVKVAKDMYASQLEDATNNESFISKLSGAYGKDFAEDFKQDYLGIYESMPSPDKQNIIEMARESKDEG